MTPAELDYKLAVEDEWLNFATALWCLSTASQPYWPDVARLLDFDGPAVCRRHLTEPARCIRCRRPEGLLCFGVDERSAVGADGRCQECSPAQLSLFGEAA